MNLKNHSFLALLVLMTVILSVNTVYGLSFSMGDRKPLNNGKVETMKAILEVQILSSQEPMPYTWVNFYVDDEWIATEFTDDNGVARAYVGRLMMPEDAGYHTWKVRVDKTGYTTYWSPVWRFNYQPRPVLKIFSDYGAPYGVGSYTYGATANFGFTSNAVIVSEGERRFFVGWTSPQMAGYNGPECDTSVKMLNDINEYASWKTQYYLNISCELPQMISPKSGWYDEGTILKIQSNNLLGVRFHSWIGSGNGSYTGTEESHFIKMSGPINQEAVIERDTFSLTINNEYGDSWGAGLYSAYENVSFGVDNRFIYFDEGVRICFQGWSTTSKNGYNGNETESMIQIKGDIQQNANWVQQFYVDLSYSEGGSISASSGWMDIGSILNVTTEGLENYRFKEWVGEGDSSLNTIEKNITLYVFSPIKETAVWEKEYTIKIDSPLPVTGDGIYLDGEKVTISATQSEGLIIRNVFKKWSGDIDSTDSSYKLIVTRDMNIIAEYEKNYTYFIAILLLIVLAVGAIGYMLLRK